MGVPRKSRTRRKSSFNTFLTYWQVLGLTIAAPLSTIVATQGIRLNVVRYRSQAFAAGSDGNGRSFARPVGDLGCTVAWEAAVARAAVSKPPYSRGLRSQTACLELTRWLRGGFELGSSERRSCGQLSRRWPLADSERGRISNLALQTIFSDGASQSPSLLGLSRATLLRAQPLSAWHRQQVATPLAGARRSAVSRHSKARLDSLVGTSAEGSLGLVRCGTARASFVFADDRHVAREMAAHPSALSKEWL
jgi:hypothetical protein